MAGSGRRGRSRPRRRPGRVRVTIWSAGATPAVAADGDPGAVELGVKFRSDVAGFVTGVRFYKGAGNTGTHVGNLWSSSGTLLATATFSGESASGWQQVSFSSPVAITANTTYVVVVLRAERPLRGDEQRSRRRRSTTRRCTRWRAASSGGNGVYRYGARLGVPDGSATSRRTTGSTSCSRSVRPRLDTTPPTVTSTTPAAGATGVAVAVAPTATFSEAVQAGDDRRSRSATPRRRAVAGLERLQRRRRGRDVHAVGAAWRPVPCTRRRCRARRTWPGTRWRRRCLVVHDRRRRRAACPCSIWSAGATPAVAADGRSRRPSSWG